MTVEIRLEQTCFACPEQYDAFVGDRRVGYLRLRHGRFRVECPDCGGETVYTADPAGDGIFEEAERHRYLDAAKAAIVAWIERQPIPPSLALPGDDLGEETI